MELRSYSDQLVGKLFISPNLSNRASTTLITSFLGSGDRVSSNRQELVSAALNITLLDRSGNLITRLDSSLTICLALSNTAKKGRVCLSYFDELKGKWRCEDECLTTISTKGAKANDETTKGNILCGKTGHLTNFALLLIGNDREDPCQSKDNTLAWVSLGMVAGAVVVVALSVFVVEFRIRWMRRLLDKELSRAFSQPNL